MLGLGLGVNLQRVVISLINRLLSILKGRSTYFENESATKSLLNALNTDGLLEKASILITPTAYSDVKINSAKPIEATADLNFTRGSGATRTNAQGSRENSQGNNTPRINYKDGVGSWLIEPQSTNLYLNSALIVTQNITTLASSYTVSFYGTGTITFTGTYSGSLTGTGVNDRVRITFTTTSGTLTSTVSGTVTQGQAEEGNITSYIPTNGSVQTRLEETASKSGLGDLIDSTQGVLYAEMSALANVNIQRTLSISDGTHSNSVKLGFSKDVTDYKIFANVRLGGVSQVFLTFNLGNVEPTFKKCAIKYKQNDFSLWVNGIEVATSTIGSTFTLNTLNYFAFNRGNGGQIFEGDIKSLAIFPILTDEELECLTTE